jgi:hypothetical protein
MGKIVTGAFLFNLRHLLAGLGQSTFADLGRIAARGIVFASCLVLVVSLAPLAFLLVEVSAEIGLGKMLLVLPQLECDG